MTPTKLYVSKKNKTRRVGIFVDLDDYFKYKKFKLRFLPDGRVYFTAKGKKKYLQREILHLTSAHARVFFKSANKHDYRKSNLLVQIVPEEHRGRYGVQSLTP